MVVWSGRLVTLCSPQRSRLKMFKIINIIICLLTILKQIDANNEILDESQSLTPPYFNLALGRNITATATCGEDTDELPELYCKLTGANTDTDVNINVIHGQVCDVCDPSDPKKNHNATKAIDGIETWWQSPPLSRGSKYNEVNLTIDFGQEFHVAYVFIRMGNSPRPGLWVLEKSVDYGKTFTPWQYFSESPIDCEYYFGKETLQPILRDSSVTCTTDYSQIVPLEGGEIPISLLKNRPSANMYFNSTELQEWTRATNVRLRLLRTKTLLGHLMSVARQDPTVTRRYFYSIKDISIGGRCMCNGHADTCQLESRTSNKLICQCVHRTCGPQCAECCPNYVQKKWRQSTSFNPFVCEKCNCFNHATECIYDPEVDQLKQSIDIYGNYEGGGVCQNCQHNTEGINCNRCKPKYFKPYNKRWNETDVCHPCNCDTFYSTGNCAEGSGQCECKPAFQLPDCKDCSEGYFGYPDCRPCECNINGTRGKQCESDNGRCACKFNYDGSYCDTCASGFYDFPKCLPCECNARGSLDSACHSETGNCNCKNNYQGRTCDECSDGFYEYPICTYCNCDSVGTEPGICDKNNGSCLCKPGYGGERCDRCIPGYFGYPNCQPCNCSDVGSSSSVCDETGTCSCLSNFASRTCEQCSPGYYKYPECLYCNCYTKGSNGISCDSQGRCQCHANFNGDRCDTCTEGFYNFPNCEECNCHPAGVVTAFAGCGSVPAGQLCECKDRVQGRICDKCRPLYWNLNPNNPDGCEECTCHIPGVMGAMGVCDTETGQCVCKPSVTSHECNSCKDGSYNLQENNLFGCTDCGCDIGGSVNNVCDKNSGQCQCHPRIQGKQCNKPMQNHYFPTLHQYQYEIEDGRTPRNNKVRFGFFEEQFPNFSWKGYGLFSELQREIIQDVYIHKSSLYRMVLRYINKKPEDAVGKIEIIPDNPSDIEQSFTVVFKPSDTPAFVTVSGLQGLTPSPFVMNPGKWSISIKINKDLLLDYFVLIPAAFYEATILTKDVKTPCIIGEKGFCRHYNYPSIAKFDTVHGVGGFTSIGDERGGLKEYYNDINQLRELEENEIPLINENQLEINFDVTISKTGAYVILVNYITPVNDNRTHDLSVETSDQHGREKGRVVLYACPYTTVCRQVVTDRDHRVAVFAFNSNNIRTLLKGRENPQIGIKSITFIPYEQWSLDYILPQSVCVRKDGLCVPSKFPLVPDSKKVQIESGNEDLVSKTLPPNIFKNTSQLIRLSEQEPMIDVSSKVPSPGNYVFVIHYYQPNHPKFDLSVVVHNGRYYEGHVPVPHCPSNSGCRSIVELNNGETIFALTENFVVTLKEPDDKSVWLDYILVIPADSYRERILHQDKLDQTGEFITTCGQNNFHISTTEEGFCRDSVFSLTAAYNNGAKPCQCDFDGSLSFECEVFGGQCPCKPNIIGRKCEICKAGYYGFPDCQQCNCPVTAYCEPNTGECICLPHVTGPNCNECVPLTYGFDLSIGCEECKCDPLGVLDGNLQCDLLTGNCQCKPNVVDRTCNRCLPGYYSFPYCEECECDLRGTTDDICDLQSAECFCKANVYGNACDLCQDGSFNLQINNPEGCTKCFCFGKTTRCTSSDYYRIEIIHMDSWIIAAVDINEDEGDVQIDPLLLVPEKYDHDTIEISGDIDKERLLYISAPEIYLGNKLTAYGGVLQYTALYYSKEFGQATNAPDLILKGADAVLLHRSLEQPTSGINVTLFVDIIEESFTLPNGVSASREILMTVLENLAGIYIRSTYWNESITTRISDVYLEIATSQFLSNSTLASAVEDCQCPPNYVGLSCEKCAPGYYRIDGPYGGYCVPCQCNGHSSTCDVQTGICLDCDHNTAGDHCEKCEIGYHGDATIGTARDCLICACPVPLTSNNFGVQCDVSADGNFISCECREGYTGSRCESCTTGYYGRPEELGDYCKPCNCSGNIDSTERGACDTVSGECLKCLNNTFGKVCELCKPGYYGDAIQQKNCQRCDCDDLGTEFCDNADGTCHCRPNVVGQKCDRCEENHYGFESGVGCLNCDCSIASNGSQCDPINGQCRCQPGVTGRNCDTCVAGYWNFTENGCTSCGCHSEYSMGVGCNQSTGECTCLKDVKGVKCDHCEHRWVFIPDRGCYESDSCVHDLLDITDSLQAEINPIMEQFQTISSNYFTSQRLTYINETVDKFTPQVSKLNPNNLDLKSLNETVTSLNQNTKNLDQKMAFALQNANKSIENASAVKKLAFDILNVIKETATNTYQTVDDVDSIVDRLETGSSVQLDPAIKKSKNISNEMSSVNFTTALNYTNKQLNKTKVLLNKMMNFSTPRNEQSDFLDNLRKQNTDFDLRLNNITEFTNLVNEKADKVSELNTKNREFQVSSKVDRVAERIFEIEEKLNSSNVLVKNASAYNTGAKNTFDNLSSNELELMRVKNTLNITVLSNDREIDDVRNNLNNAKVYEEDLVNKANILEELLNKTHVSDVDDAVQAANAYKIIVSDVNNTQNLLNLTNTYNKNTTKILKGLQNQTYNADNISNNLLQSAADLLDSVYMDVEPQVNEAKENVTAIKRVLDDAIVNLNKVNSLVDNKKVFKPINDISSAISNSQQADSTALSASDLYNDINDNLPHKLEEAKQLPKVYHDALQEMNTANNKLQNINKILPDLKDLLDQVTPDRGIQQRDVLDIHNKIEKLNEMIAQARDEVNRIDVGAQFYRNSTLQLKNPSVLPSLSTSTKVSFYFQTENKNGFLLYLGNEQGTKLRRTKTDDFMAIEIQNGFPVLTIDLGNGPKKIIGNKYVADNNWYQIIVERIGKNIKLIIREETPTQEVKTYVTEDKLQGTNSIFNLDEAQSKLYVGGYPLASRLQLQNSDPAFEGKIEELVIGGKKVSLWNFVDGSNIKMTRTRNKLINTTPPSGYRFDGQGYLKLDARPYISANKLGLSLKIKTEATDGLIFLIAKDESYLSLEVRDGFVVYQYKLGDNAPAFVQSTKAVNDGKWHKIQAGRFNQDGRLKIDNNAYNLTSKGSNTDLKLSDDMYFGGYPGHHPYGPITNADFDGCIDEVTIEVTTVDLNSQLAAYDVTPGCSPKFHGMVSFDKNNPGYLRYPNATTRLEFEITLTISTLQADGIIFYATNELQNDTLSLSLVNGDLVLKNKNTTLRSSYIKLNDGERYVITATHDAESLKIFVNDYESFTQVQSLPVRKFTYKFIYFGGIPTNLLVPENILASRTPFAGCIEDVTLNGIIINFANAADKSNVILGNCSASAVLDRPQLPHIKYKEPITTTFSSDADDFTTIGFKDDMISSTTTTVRSTTLSRQMTLPPQTDHCALPLDPETESIGYNSGYRFGTMQYSRIEYDENALPIRHKNSMNISLEIKLDEPNDVFSDAVLFYAADKDHNQFTALVLNQGKLEFRFKIGEEVSSILHDKSLNDGEWHHVSISRHHLVGKLTVDNDAPITDTLLGENQSFNVQAPIYLGGIAPKISNVVNENLGVNTALFGCIRNFHHNGKLVGEPYIMPDVVPCSEQVESGIYFTKDGGYVKLDSKFKVGVQFTVQLDIKPRKNTGIVLSIHGRKDHLILTLKDGDIIVTVKNKDDPPFEATFKPNSPYYFCNGNWHTIVVLKSKNVVTLSVDNVMGTTGVGRLEKKTDTKHGLFIGGHPYASKLSGFNITKEPYVGCMKNIIINDKLINIKEKPAYKGVRYNVCPTI